MSFFELFIWSCWGLAVFCGLVAGAVAVEDGDAGLVYPWRN